MAGGDAGLATGAAVERNFEGILFAAAGFGEGDEAAIVVGEVWLAALMGFGKPGDGSLELFLLGEELVDEVGLLVVGLGRPGDRREALEG